MNSENSLDIMVGLLLSLFPQMVKTFLQDHGIGKQGYGTSRVMYYRSLKVMKK